MCKAFLLSSLIVNNFGTEDPYPCVSPVPEMPLGFTWENTFLLWWHLSLELPPQKNELPPEKRNAPFLGLSS